MARVLFVAYNSIPVALLLACISFKITWLEMRVNIGYLLPAYVLVAALVLFLFWRKSFRDTKEAAFSRKHALFTLANLLFCAVLSLGILGPGSLPVVPAAIIREGLGVSRLSFMSINVVVILVLLTGLALISGAQVWRIVKEGMLMNKRKFIMRLSVVVVLVALVCVYFFVVPVNQGVNEVAGLLASGDTALIRDFINSYGVYAAVVSFLLMVFQSVLAPLPAFLITFANANLFGWWQGAILSWSSAMVGAVLCFYIARILGRDAVSKLTTIRALKEVDQFFERYGAHSVLIARLLPFISFDIVSYAAGLTPMRFRSFIIATGVGQLPATIVYSYVGGMLTGGAQALVTALLIIFALFTLIFLLRLLWKDRLAKKLNPAEQATNQEADTAEEKR